MYPVACVHALFMHETFIRTYIRAHVRAEIDGQRTNARIHNIDGLFQNTEGVSPSWNLYDRRVTPRAAIYKFVGVTHECRVIPSNDPIWIPRVSTSNYSARVTNVRDAVYITSRISIPSGKEIHRCAIGFSRPLIIIINFTLYYYCPDYYYYFISDIVLIIIIISRIKSLKR